MGGVVGAALILGLLFFLIRRRKKPTAPSTVASWKSGPSIGNPFDDAVSLSSNRLSESAPASLLQ